MNHGSPLSKFSTAIPLSSWDPSRVARVCVIIARYKHERLCEVARDKTVLKDAVSEFFEKIPAIPAVVFGASEQESGKRQ